MSDSSLPEYARTLVPLLISSGVLAFGSFTLKSGRPSPYFFNLNLLHSGSLIKELSNAYTQAIVDSPSLVDKNPDGSFAPNFDILFGPAYKGIPIAATTCLVLQEKFGIDVSYSFNRKEVKDHGEGGSIVGAPLKGKKILIIDDVMTSGLAISQAYNLIVAEGGNVIGMAVCLDREEKARDSDLSAVMECERKFGVGVVRVLKLTNIIEFLRESGDGDKVKMLEDHKKICGV
jgi:orotate phosphoribosyltransferase